MVAPMFYLLAPGVAWVAILPIPLILWGSFAYQERTEPALREMRDASGRIASQVVNNVGGMATVKSFTAEGHEVERLRRLSDLYRASAERPDVLASAFNPLVRIAVLIGFQGVAFNFCARIYALQEGFLPQDPTLERMFGIFKLETGLAAGAAFFAVGLLGVLYSTIDRSAAGTVAPDPAQALLWGVPSAAALCLGGQIVFTSVLLSFIGLRRR